MAKKEPRDEMNVLLENVRHGVEKLLKKRTHALKARADLAEQKYLEGEMRVKQAERELTNQKANLKGRLDKLVVEISAKDAEIQKLRDDINLLKRKMAKTADRSRTLQGLVEQHRKEIAGAK